MDVVLVARLISTTADLLSILVFVTVALSWFLPSYHPVREALDRLVDPMLAPIRRVVPLIGMLDISPIILMILITVVARILITLVLAL